MGDTWTETVEIWTILKFIHVFFSSGAYAPPRVIAVSPQQKQKGKKNHPLDTSIVETVFPSPPPSPLSNPTRSIQHTPFSFDEISHLSHKRISHDHTNEVAVKKYAPIQGRDIPLPQNEGNLARDVLKTSTREVHIPQRQRKLTTNSSSWSHSPNSLGTIVSSQDSQKVNHFGDLLRDDTQLHPQDLKTRQLFPIWRGDATHKYISGASSKTSVWKMHWSTRLRQSTLVYEGEWIAWWWEHLPSASVGGSGFFSAYFRVPGSMTTLPNANYYRGQWIPVTQNRTQNSFRRIQS